MEGVLKLLFFKDMAVSKEVWLCLFFAIGHANSIH